MHSDNAAAGTELSYFTFNYNVAYSARIVTRERDKITADPKRTQNFACLLGCHDPHAELAARLPLSMDTDVIT